MIRLLTALPLLAASAVASAQWQPSAELGIVATSGNSDTTSVNGRFGLTGEDADWTHDYHLAALRTESNDDLTANRYEIGARSARKLGERSYLGAAARYENDDFAAYDYQGTFALNYGTWLLRDEHRSLQLEGGPGVRLARGSETGEDETSALLRGFGEYKHQLTDSTRFFNTLLVEAADDNTFAQNDIGIAVSINKSLALKAAYQVRHNTEVPVGTERTDTLTSVNIVWSPKAE
ncbi:DUF481 domain-containing protein [Arenimonas caeni]|uniref:DUF481 domain-containing protein n=1 Tax=Arenimonas caeni TaxID=2058085 RepID=A0A2P6M770_9GAMM|nr:DUF481 domain-containing protein [Arenimonas caeni]PRH81832.1 DUF481 domain-containing protein [Arenimonas caeni]